MLTHTTRIEIKEEAREAASEAASEKEEEEEGVRRRDEMKETTRNLWAGAIGRLGLGMFYLSDN